MGDYYLFIQCILVSFLVLSVRGFVKKDDKVLRWLTLSLIIVVAAFLIIPPGYHRLLGPFRRLRVMYDPREPSVDWKHEFLKDLALFVAMLCGMVAKYLYDRIEERRLKNETRMAHEPKYGIQFDFWDFIQPVFVSASIFILVIGQKQKRIPFDLLALFSFQNGFFWQTIHTDIASKIARKPQSRSSRAAKARQVGRET
jgi:hypothetical protein